MKMIKGITIICIVFIAFSINTKAAEIRVSSYEELEEAINTSEEIEILITQDIVVPHAISVSNGEVIIKSCDDNLRNISSAGTDYIFYIDSNASIVIKSINIETTYEFGPFSGEGMASFVNSSVIMPYTYNSKTSKRLPQNTEIDDDKTVALDIANFVITWSGFLLAFITIVYGLLAFLGFRELRDLKRIRGEIEADKESINSSYNNIKEIEKSTEQKLSDLKLHFENDANSIMFGTYNFSLGTNYYKQGQYLEAIKYLKQSVSNIPQNTKAMCMLGRAYTFIGKKDKALECYKEALKIDKDCADAYRGLAAWYRHIDIKKAIANAEKAIELVPNDIELLNYYAQLLMDDGKKSDALNVFKESYALKPHPDTDFFLAIIYLSDKTEDSLVSARYHINEAMKGYGDEEEFGPMKKVWLELTKWIHLLIKDKDEKRFDNAFNQLKQVNTFIESEKTRIIVQSHVKRVLEYLAENQEYVDKSMGAINGEN